jgi:uncharacterized protein Yka (UPF0111/DUF47 family)
MNRRPKSIPFDSDKRCSAMMKSSLKQVTSLNRIYKEVNMSGYSDEVVERLKKDISFISKKYDIGSRSAVLLAAILEKTNTGNGVDREDLAHYLGCSNIEFISCGADLRELEKKGIIQVNNCHREVFRITNEAFKAIEKDADFVPPKMSGLTAEELFMRIRGCFIRYRKDDIDEDRLIEELDSLVHNNDHLTFCRKALDSSLYDRCDDTERRMFFYLCHRFVMHGESSVEVDTLLHFVDGMILDPMTARNCLSAGSTDMQTSGLVEFANEDGMANTEALSLSDVVRNEFLEGVERKEPPKETNSDLVSADSIVAKELFYNEAEAVQIGRLAGLLEEENYQGIRTRLAETGMRKGFNVLFYGAPGTGKTASAFELARRSGRDIFVIDMSKLRSKWVGDSEKCIKSVFNIYRRMCRKNGRVPILLFNEADAIFMKRIENVEHSVDQMNNTMQNIILQEMENLDGILIATTNLVGNLDPAFERRFLYKVEFHKPDAASRAKIWKSMIGSLSEADATTLARRYEFSGGNIENVARKSSVEYVLTGQQPTVDTLSTFCEEETYAKAERKRIGF